MHHFRSHPRLADNLPDKLKQLGQYDEAMTRLKRAEQQLGYPASGYRLHDPAIGKSLEGVVLERGLSDEVSERGYLIVGSRDGILHQVAVSNLAQEESRVGQVIRVQSPPDSRTVQPVFVAQHQLPLNNQITYRGRTWLDEHYHELVEDSRPQGVAVKLRHAAVLRAQWLAGQGRDWKPGHEPGGGYQQGG